MPDAVENSEGYGQPAHQTWATQVAAAAGLLEPLQAFRSKDRS